MNKVMLMGHLGKDPQLQYLPSGSPVANFSMATNKNWTDKEGKKQSRTQWHRIQVFGKMAEVCHKYLKAGRQVFIEGELDTRKWTDSSNVTRWTTSIRATRVQFLGGKKSEDEPENVETPISEQGESPLVPEISEDAPF